MVPHRCTNTLSIRLLESATVQASGVAPSGVASSGVASSGVARGDTTGRLPQLAQCRLMHPLCTTQCASHSLLMLLCTRWMVLLQRLCARPPAALPRCLSLQTGSMQVVLVMFRSAAPCWLKQIIRMGSVTLLLYCVVVTTVKSLLGTDCFYRRMRLVCVYCVYVLSTVVRKCARWLFP